MVRSLRLISSLILTGMLLLFPLLSVHAESAADSSQLNTAESTETPSSTVPPTTAQPTTEEVIPADFPALTVNAISNLFPNSSAEYSVTKKQVEVTYWLRSSRDILSIQWFMTYDPEVLTLSPELNTPEMICPAAGKFCSVDYGEDMLRFTASSTSLFDFSSQTAPFVRLVFDVNELNPEMPEITKVDLTVDVLIAAKRDSKTGSAVPDSEVIIVNNSGLSQKGIDMVSLKRRTTLTPGNFVQATHDEPTNPTTSAVTTAPTVSPTIAPTSPTPTEPKKPENEPPLKTGSLFSVCLILGIEIVATGALFVMRKKEILY